MEITNLIESIDRKEIDVDTTELDRFSGEGKIPYFSNGMFGTPLLNDTPISDAPLYLQPKFNFCPKCDKYGLEFEIVGLFD